MWEVSSPDSVSGSGILRFGILMDSVQRVKHAVMYAERLYLKLCHGKGK
jgi:hypothetical protein